MTYSSQSTITSLLNSIPSEIEEKIKCKLEKEESINQYFNGIGVGLCLPDECSESSTPVYKYFPITLVDEERTFSAYKYILTDNRHSLSPENIEKKILVTYCDASLFRE